MKKYLVGGAVRDKILKIPIKERDWVIVGGTPAKMIKLGYRQVGKSFPVFLHPTSKEEYALARTERKVSKGHKGFSFEFSSDVTLEEDLKRRDLTINAIAQDEFGNLIDPYNGKKDINSRCLRHVSISFMEDPLRILRVARFAAKFAHLNFKVHNETMELMKKMTQELNFISSERIWKETRHALSTKNPHVYFQVLKTCDALKILFPEIDTLFNCVVTKGIVAYNAGEYVLNKLYSVSQISNSIKARFVILCGSMVMSTYNYKISIKNIEKCKILITRFCSRLTIPKKLSILVQNFIGYYMYIFNKQINSINLMKFFYSIDAWRNPSNLDEILIYVNLDAKLMDYKNTNFIIKTIKQAFDLARLVEVKDIIKKGYIGKNIKRHLNKERILAIKMYINKRF